jgi:protein-S-isoprenylcysteine O-methyltransferase Ste14
VDAGQAAVASFQDCVPMSLHLSSPAVSIDDKAGSARPDGVARILDAIERLLIFSIYGYFAYRCIAAFVVKPGIAILLLVISESLPLLFVVFRKSSTSLSRSPLDWTVALAGTIAPLLINPASNAHPPIWVVSAGAVALLLGLMIEMAAKITLGRNFGMIAANRGVVTDGPYRFLRHPMYAGYTLAHIGFLLSAPSWFNAAFYASALALQIARIMREERLLMQDEAYRAFAARVRYRLLPGIF